MTRASLRKWLFGFAIFVMAGGCEEVSCSGPVSPPPPPPPAPPAPFAQSIIKESGDGAIVAGSGVVTLAVKVLSNLSAPFPGATVGWSTTSGSLAAATSLSGSDGIARINWTLPAAAGPYQVLATLSSALLPPTQTFSATVDACVRPVPISDNFDSGTLAGWLVVDSMSTAYLRSETPRTLGGNPVGYREMQHIVNNAGEMNVYHLLDMPYDPSAAGNAIHHINYTEDRIVVPPAPFVGAQVGSGFFFVQVPNFGGFGMTTPRYAKIVGTGIFTNTTWEVKSFTGLTAADFTPTAGAPAAVFGAGGAPIRFGYLRRNSSPGVGTTTVNHGIDNFTVTICRF